MRICNFVLLACWVILTEAGAVIAGDLATVYSQTPQGTLLGTAFCANSESNTLVTCYHTVFNSTRIDVSIGGRLLSSDTGAIKLIEVAPSLDLAILEVTGVQLSGYPVITDMNEIRDGARAGDPIAMYGFPNGMPVQKFMGSISSDGLISASKIRDAGSKPVFPGSKLQVLAFDMTVGPGCSGAPLIVNGRVVGVLSGSLTESFARTMAWGIPTGYLGNDAAFQAVTSKLSAWKWKPLDSIGLFKAARIEPTGPQVLTGVWEEKKQGISRTSEHWSILKIRFFSRDDPRNEKRKEPRPDEIRPAFWDRYFNRLGAAGLFEFQNWYRNVEAGSVPGEWKKRTRPSSGLIALRSDAWVTLYEATNTNDPFKPFNAWNVVLEDDGSIRMSYTQSTEAKPSVTANDWVFNRIRQ